MESLNLQVVAVLVPLEIKRHTIPHLKALICNIEHASRNGNCIAFKQHYPVLKSAISLHKRAKRWFHVTIAVAKASKNQLNFAKI